MVRKNTFELVGYFNENYISCFEDVELNMICLAKGFENFNNGECVAYHYESQTRNDDPENIEAVTVVTNRLPWIFSALILGVGVGIVGFYIL
jgi:GT2 family glycosyltransferase